MGSTISRPIESTMPQENLKNIGERKMSEQEAKRLAVVRTAKIRKNMYPVAAEARGVSGEGD
ncbi:MAG: hypothetical protein ACFFDI_09005 [Promethearchaeota archaeon]